MRALPLAAGARIVIASTNRVKILAVQEAFRRVLPHFDKLGLEFTGVATSSGVPDQPFGDRETLTGALNRIASLRREYSDTLIVALEGGVGSAFGVSHELTPGGPAQRSSAPDCTLEGWRRSESPHGPGAACGSGAAGTAGGDKLDLECFAWAVLRTPAGAVSQARSASFTLPPRVSELVHDGMELGMADDQVFQRAKSGQGSGTIGKLTHGVVTRQGYYEHAVLCALVPLLNPDLYPGFELLVSPGGVDGT